MTDDSERLASVHVLRVTLRDVRPATWRRLEVPSAITLGRLHAVLQVVFGWNGDHLHEFEVRGVRYTPDFEKLYGSMLSDAGDRDEDLTSLGRVAPRSGDIINYTYDFGDDWRHRLVVEGVGPARSGGQYPGCIDGSGQAPEEDTGRVRPGRFGGPTRDRINAQLRLIGAVDGRDLPAEEMQFDPHFTGLFPDLNDDSAECPCGCGQTSAGSDQSLLPMLHPVPEEELAGLAAGSPLVQRAVALATWLGSGRALTPSRLLRPADATRAVAELGLTEGILRCSGDDAPAVVTDAGNAGEGPSVRAGSAIETEPKVGQQPAGRPGHRPASQVRQLFGETDPGDEVRATEVRATEVRATEVRATEVRATEVRAAEVRATRAGGRRVRSAKELPSLHPLWAGCLASKLIEIRGQRACPGPGLAVWQSPADPAAQVESWCALLGGYLRARGDVTRAGRDHLSQTCRQMLALTIPLLYVMAHEPVPVGALSLAFADLDELADMVGPPLLLRLPVLFAELACVTEDWLVVGALEQIALPQPDADQLVSRIAELRAGVEELAGIEAHGLSTDPAETMELRAALSALVQTLLDSPAVRLTPLGGYGLARVLTAHGWQVPRVGACLDTEPEDLLDGLARYLAPDAEAEAARWVAARGEDWASAVEQVMWSAAVKGGDGPVRRGLLPTLLVAAGPRVAPVLDAAAGDPWLAPVLAVVRYQLDLGPEPSVGQLLWLTVDGLSAALADPDDFSEELRESPLEHLLALPSGLATAAGLGHPQAREVLQVAAPQLDDPDLARALRKALARRM